MAESGGPATPRSRKLWIDSSPFTLESLKDQQKCKELSPPVVKLTHFAPKPCIDFGHVKVGKTKTVHLLVENPNQYDVDVKVEKFPWKKNFNLNEEVFVVMGDGYHVLEISWAPKEGGNCREVIMMKYDLGFRVHAVIIGNAEEQKKKTHVRGRRNLGAAFTKKRKAIVSSKYNQSQPSCSDLENINPVLNDTSTHSGGVKFNETPSVEETVTGKALEGIQPTSIGKEMHNAIRKALVPLHVVNAGNSRDSCGSITAPASPSGLEAPVIKSSSSSPMFRASLENHSDQKTPVPMETNCFGLKATRPVVQFMPEQIESNGRPTFLISKAIACIPKNDNVLESPMAKQNKGGLNSPRCLTPRSHRRSKTYTKRLMTNPNPGVNQCVAPPNMASSTPNLLDYALAMIAPPSESKVETDVVNRESEYVSSEDGTNSASLKKLGSSSEDCEPTMLSSSIDKATATSLCHTGVDRLSSTYANDKMDVTACLPVPDISAIGSDSSIKFANKKYCESSRVKRRPSTVQALKASRKEISKPSPKFKTAKKTATPKRNVLQWRRECKGSGSAQSLKSSKLLTAKPSSGKKLRPSPKRLTNRNTERPRSAKKRKVKLPMKRLVLKATAKASEPAKVTLGMPFLSRNRFYDERWRQKQEHAFTAWLNFILTPDEFKTHFEWNAAIGIAKKDKQKSMTKETASLRAYEIEKRRQQLRRAGFMLYETDKFTEVVQNIEEAVESNQISLREDKQLWADIGNRAKVVNLLMAFNPLWLRLGLEIAFAEERVTLTSLESSVLSGFITKKLLSNSFIEREFAHPSVPHSYRAGYSETISKHMLKKFLILILFLDRAKQMRLIDHDPCLFNKGAEFRNCKDILQVFSRDLLRGEGDIIKHLGFLGYRVCYQQTYIDEFDFGISKIAVDLRDGIRLVRIVELLFHRHDLTSQLRLPAGSLLQKKHNVNIAIRALMEHGVDMCDANGKKIEAEHVVRGHCEMTLALLWNMALFFQVEGGVDTKTLKGEIEYLQKILRLKRTLEDTTLYEDEESGITTRPTLSGASSLLLEWSRLVCSFKSIPVYNFSASFSDGRVLASLIAHYQSNLINQTQVNMLTTFNQKDLTKQQSTLSDSPYGDAVDQAVLLKNEKANLRLVQNALYEMGGIPNLLRIEDVCNTIPDEKVVRLLLSFLCSRLLDISSQDRAARIIQVSWRAYRFRIRMLLEKKAAEELIKRQNQAAIIIQSAYRRYKIRIAVKKRTESAIVIQRLWRQKQDVRPFRMKFLRMKNATLRIQAYFRGNLARKHIAELRRERQRREHAANVIQNVWRSMLVRRMYCRIREATLKIQRALRNYWFAKRVRKSYLNYRRAVVVIQIRWRATYLMRREVAIFTTKRESAIIIQRAYRRYQHLKQVCATMVLQRGWRRHLKARELEKKKKLEDQAACIIQTHWRSYLARKMLVRLRVREEAALLIQSYWNGHVLMKKERTHFLIKRHAAIKIQSLWRGHAARTRFQYMKQRIYSAIIIQQKWRAVLEMRIQQAAFHAKRYSVIAIQSYWRSFLLRRRILEQRRLTAIRKIEMWWKATLEMKMQHEQYGMMKTSAVIIQSYWRSFVVRKQLAHRRKAAKTIQQYLRGFNLMRIQREEFLMKRQAALKMQSMYRGHVARKLVSKMKLEICSVIMIQRHWRATLEMRKDRKWFQMRRCSAVTIQSYWRGFVVRRHYLQVQQKVVKIQMSWRATLEMRKHRDLYGRLRNNVIAIQSHWRGYIVRTNITTKRNAVVLIQKYWRGFIQMKELKEDFQMKKCAAIKIQSVWRGHVARHLVQRMRLQIRSAVIIQQSWRAMLEMRNQRNEFQMMRNGVVTIQSYWRGFVVRRNVDLMQKSAVMIQAWWRGMLEMMRQRDRLRIARANAVLIQSLWRGYVVRKRLKLERKAVETVQKCWRGFILVKKLREEFQIKRLAIVKIQSFWRGCIARNFVQTLIQERRSAVMIQRYWRAVLEMRKQKTLYHSIRSSAIIIQSHWRGLAVRRQLVQMQMSARTIQVWWKAELEMRRQHQLFNTMQRNALVIQSCWRGYYVRKGLQMKHESATTIQKFWRGYVLMKIQKEEFYEKKQATLKIQSVFRGYAARKFVKKMILEIKSATMIQQKWRAYLKMRKERELFIVIQKSAIVIQKTWRGYTVRKHIQECKQSVGTIQTYWRGYVLMKHQRQEFLSMRSAILRIQCAYRQYVARKELQRKKLMLFSAIVIQQRWQALLKMRNQQKSFLHIRKCCVIIQTAWRQYVIMKQQREKFVATRNAVIKIQCTYRRYIAKKVLERKKLESSCAVLIQRKWRATLEMRTNQETFLRIRKCCITIQSVWRCYLAKQQLGDAKKKHNAAIVIQNWLKATLSMHRQRQAYRKIKLATILIQRKWREMLCIRECQKNFYKIKQSIIVIQSFGRRIIAKNVLKQLCAENTAAHLIQQTWRNYKLMQIDRRNFVKTKNAAIVIQSCFRGFHARQEFKALKIQHTAAIIIQQWFKSTMLTRQIRREFLEQVHAAIVIQRFFQYVLKTKQAEGLKRRRAAIVIQQKWKATLAMQKQRLAFLHIRSSVVVVQSCIRRYLIVQDYRKLRNVTIALQQKFRNELRARRDRQHFLSVVCSVRLIQRIYRGYCVRKNIKDDKIVAAKFKCVEASRNAQEHPEKKICNRMNSALNILLRAKSYDVVYSTLEDLISLSKLLPYCCERISEDGGTEVLCRLISSTNRSFHAAFVQHFSISILLNLLQNQSTRSDTTQVLTSEKDGVIPFEMLVTVLSRFREKGNRDPSHAMVFCSACSLLLELCRECRNVKIMKSKQKSVEMIRFIAKETNNKLLMKRQKQAFQRKKKESTSFLTLSSTPVNKAANLDNTTISCRETSFTKRVASPRLNVRRSNAENQDPSRSRKTVDRTDATAKKIVTGLFKQENSTAPKIKQALAPKALWHTNVPIQRSKRVTKPHSPKFHVGRARNLAASNPAIVTTTNSPVSPRRVLQEVELRTINFDSNDQASCINALAKILS